jgi:hypothetical protein
MIPTLIKFRTGTDGNPNPGATCQASACHRTICRFIKGGVGCRRAIGRSVSVLSHRLLRSRGNSDAKCNSMQLVHQRLVSSPISRSEMMSFRLGRITQDICRCHPWPARRGSETYRQNVARRGPIHLVQQIRPELHHCYAQCGLEFHSHRRRAGFVSPASNVAGKQLPRLCRLRKGSVRFVLKQ